jgi:hypothetical protein
VAPCKWPTRSTAGLYGSPRACKNFGVWLGHSLSRVSPVGAWHSKVGKKHRFYCTVIASMGEMEVSEKEKRKNSNVLPGPGEPIDQSNRLASLECCLHNAVRPEHNTMVPSEPVPMHDRYHSTDNDVRTWSGSLNMTFFFGGSCVKDRTAPPSSGSTGDMGATLTTSRKRRATR